MIIIGIIIIICSLIFTGWALVTNKSNKTGLVILCLFGIFAGIYFINSERATEIGIDGVGTIKMAKKSAQADAKIVEELRKRVESEATKIQEVKKRLYSMFKLNASGSIDPLRPMNFDFWEFVEDAGVVTAMNLPVSSTPDPGDEMSYYFRNNSSNNLGVCSKADGAGGVEEIWVEHVKATVYVPSHDQVILNDSAILVDNSIVRVVGSGAVVLDTAPAIEDGFEDGQKIIIQGTHDTNTVQIADNCNCQLAGGIAMTLGKGDTIQLIWDSGDSEWYEITRGDN